ncbi:MAG: sigma-70 family RNA polymerase sigma factor [Phycisphaerae bacterium]|nr:sigma-70 family RNA polymerase sigma factor [Phycisphaerae bacterium]
MTDALTLVREATEGSADALSVLLERHGPEVTRRLEIDRQWRGQLDAEDVMQVTYLEAFLQIGRFDPSRAASFESWLLQIARHNLLDAVRGLGRRKLPQPRQRVHADGADSMNGLLELLGATTTTPSRVAGRAESASMLERAMSRLPTDYAAVVRLYDLEGRPIEEVAAAMRRSAGAVHMLRARAHDALREHLGTESKFFSDPA